MSDNLSKAIEFAHKNKDRYLQELIELVNIPSISTDSEYKPQMHAAAEWLVARLESAGIQNIQILDTGGHPVVYGENLQAGQDAPTITIYGHYDVQPADPLDLWETAPFEAQVRDGKLFGRGASDMKGQVMASIQAVEAVAKHGGLPVNVKFFIEGEEETGSTNLAPFIEKHKDLLACDFALNPDSGMLGADKPTIAYALRGLIYSELWLEGPSSDLHSGMFGGAVANPANELARLIAGMHDADGRITLPRFYESVRQMDEKERAELARLPMDDRYFLENSGSPALYGEKGYTPVERVGGRPSLDVNGLLSGFTGEGSKTVMPAKAMAKFSFRLVPDQEPEEVRVQLVEYIEANLRPGITYRLVDHGTAFPTITPIDSEGVHALAAALETVWGQKPLYYRVGGTIPVVAHMKRLLGVESVLTGFGLPGDKIHAPNERLTLEPWYKGIDALIHFFHNAGKIK